MAAINITSENFEILTKQGPTIVEFWAPWCVYCRRLTAVIDKLSTAYEGRITVAQVNIDDLPALAQQFSIDTVPTFLLFRNGQAGKPLVAPGSKAEIEAWLTEQGAL